ncbi:MAG TPA: flagellar hook-length control protein FliK [Azospirillum sp.]|nr:flagellar hook-length control protein FliK [Azospirillum sp.]
MTTVPAPRRDARPAPAADDGAADAANPFADLLTAAGSDDAQDADSDRQKPPRSGAPANTDGALAAVIPWLGGQNQTPPTAPGGDIAPPALVAALGAAAAAEPAPVPVQPAQPAITPMPVPPVPTDTAPPTATTPPAANAAPQPPAADAASATTPSLPAMAAAMAALPPGDAPAEAPAVPKATGERGDAKAPTRTGAREGVSGADAQRHADSAAAAAPQAAPAHAADDGTGSGTGRRAPNGDAIAAVKQAAATTHADTLPLVSPQAAVQYSATAHTTAAATARGHTPAMQLADQLVRVAGTGGGEFHIELTPAELGRVHVVAGVSDGRVALTVQVEQADTLRLLMRDVHQLERALGEAGLRLDTDNLQFSLRGDEQQRGFSAQGETPNGDRGQSWSVAAQTVSADPVPERAPVLIDGIVDVTV